LYSVSPERCDIMYTQHFSHIYSRMVSVNVQFGSLLLKSVRDTSRYPPTKRSISHEQVIPMAALSPIFIGNIIPVIFIHSWSF
jgi:hypothetical protein